MEFKQVVAHRRTIRDFSSKAVPDEIILASLEAGLQAPSYNHLREWDFILVDDQNTRVALTQTEAMPESIPDDLAASFDDDGRIAREMYLEAIPKQKRMILAAPELLIVVYKPKTQVIDSRRIYDLNCLASVWCCIENILLSLADNNVFGVTFIPKHTEAVKAILGIPRELEVAALIPFGYKAENSKVIRQKDIDLKTRIHDQCW